MSWSVGQAAHVLRSSVIVIALVVVSGVARAQTLTTLFNFTNGLSATGNIPYTLTPGSDGNFYGTTQAGGTYNGGTIFQITPAGTLTTLFSFGSVNHEYPSAVLTLGTDGNFYGTTNYGTINGATSSSLGTGATIFKITSTGTLTTLYSFSDGSTGLHGLTLGPDGNFYGTIGGGGAHNYGAVFRMTPTGVLTTLYNFSGADGVSPGGLTLGVDGNFYGTTGLGGASFSPISASGEYGYGTIFKITPAGVLTTLHSFSGSTGGAFPGSLTLGSDGNFYGTANGIFFKVTPAGVLNKIYSFSGGDPSSGVALGSDGNFYGTIDIGGAYKYGTVFRITPAGVLTTVYSFRGVDGAGPQGSLTLGSDGNFYGTTQAGGTDNGGTLFRISVTNVPSINVNGIVDAATYTTPVAPGSIASVFGTFFIPGTTSSNSFPISTTLSGISFQFGTAPPAPLFFGSQSQFNVQIPWELAGNANTTVSVSQNGQPSSTATVPIAAYAPGIFVVNTQTAQGAILDVSYNLVGPTNPTTAGADVQIYCTGLGTVTNRPATGAPALADPLSWTTAAPMVTIGGAQALVLFSGLVPGEVGLYQVNAQVPPAASRGSNVPLTLSIGGVTSNTVFIAIQ